MSFTSSSSSSLFTRTEEERGMDLASLIMSSSCWIRAEMSIYEELPSFSAKRSFTKEGTSPDTSPPWRATSRTRDDER